MKPGIDLLLDSVRPSRDQIASHPIYSSIETLEQLRCFMEHHVYAVWDFMSLVKSLQKALTCTAVPWVPKGDADIRRFINEIALDEESDDNGAGVNMSHFELYLEAMEQCGANTARVREFVTRIQNGEPVRRALVESNVPGPSKAFVENTWNVIESKSTHRIAAAFAIGREDIVPVMFQLVVQNLQQRFPDKLSRFGYYLERHIAVDTDRHGPLARRMLTLLCGEDDTKWSEATDAAQSALRARIQLWNEIHAVSRQTT